MKVESIDFIRRNRDKIREINEMKITLEFFVHIPCKNELKKNLSLEIRRMRAELV